VAAAVIVAAACAGVLAPAPPAVEPALMQDFTVLGATVSIAAKSARTLSQLQYTTRRFGVDSTWGYRSVDSIHVRLRYQRPAADSTRIVAEYWGKCENGGVSCLRGEFVLLGQGVMAEEAVPQ